MDGTGDYKMREFKDIDTLMNEWKVEISRKKSARWVAEVLKAVDLNDDSIKTKILARIEKSKSEHPNWSGSRFFVDSCFMSLRHNLKYLRKNDEAFGIRELKKEKNFLEIETLLALWSTMEGISKILEARRAAVPKSLLNFPEKTKKI